MAATVVTTIIANLTNATTAAPVAVGITAYGIVAAVLIALLIFAVGADLMAITPALFQLILVCHFVGIISSKELLAGFSNGGVTSIALVGIIVGEISKLPAVERVSLAMFGGEKGHRTWQLAKILIVTAITSNLLPNAPHALSFTPLVSSAAIATGMNPRFALLAMSNVIGASNGALLIASASNLIASGALDELEAKSPVKGRAPLKLGMFDLAISNLLPAAVAVVYCLIVTPMLFDSELPDDEEEEAAKSKQAAATIQEEKKKKKKDETEGDEEMAEKAKKKPLMIEDSQKEKEGEGSGDSKEQQEQKEHAAAVAAAERQVAKKKRETQLNAVKRNFLSNTKFTVLFQVFASSHAAKATLGRPFGEVLEELLPASVRKQVTIEAIQPRGPKPSRHQGTASVTIHAPSAVAAAAESSNNEPTATTATNKTISPLATGDANTNHNNNTLLNPMPERITDEEEILKYSLAENDCIVATGLVPHLRSFRTLLELAWVGISDISAHSSSAYHRQRAKKYQNKCAHESCSDEDHSDAKHADELKEIKFVGTARSENDVNPREQQEQEKKQDGAAPTSPDSSSPPASPTAILHMRATREGLDAFLPVDATGNEMEKVRFITCIVAQHNPCVGQRLESRLFVETYRSTIIAARRYLDDHVLYGRELQLHVLEPGDTLLLRLRPRAAPVFYNFMNRTHFYTVEGLDNTNPTVSEVAKNYLLVPQWLADCCSCCGELGTERVFAKYGVQRAILLPEWWQNITIVIFIGVIAGTAAGLNLSACAGVGIWLMCLLGITDYQSAIKNVEWKVVTGVALSFGLGTAMQNSGLSTIIGESIGQSGITGFPMVFVSCIITAAISSIAQNKGGVQAMFPVVAKILDANGIPDARKVAAILAANSCVSGFATVFGQPSHLVIQTPGAYTGADFFKMGFPLLIIFNLLTAAMISIQFSIW